MLSDEAFERAFEWDMEQEAKQCERCGTVVEGAGDCGMEWDYNRLCFSCCDELAWKDEQEQDALGDENETNPSNS